MTAKCKKKLKTTWSGHLLFTHDLVEVLTKNKKKLQDIGGILGNLENEADEE